MTDWHDPEILFLSGRALTLIIHCALGIYLLELISTFRIDWDFISGRRRLCLGSMLYLLCRYSALVALSLSVRSVNVMTPGAVDCTVWMRAVLGMAFTAVALASGLLYLRVVALSENSRLVIWIMGAGYATIWALAGLAISKTKTVYIGELYACLPVDMSRYFSNLVFAFAYDTLCLAMMLYYLLKNPFRGQVWAFLLHQGVLSSAGICLAYLFGVVIVRLDLNDPMSNIGMVVILIVTVLCATRMQRGLCTFFQPASFFSRRTQYDDEGGYISTHMSFVSPGPGEQNKTATPHPGARRPSSVHSQTSRFATIGSIDVAAQQAELASESEWTLSHEDIQTEESRSRVEDGQVGSEDAGLDAAMRRSVGSL